MRALATQAVELMSKNPSTLTQPIVANSFVSRIAILGSGSAIAQIANVVATPLLAFLYSPSDFGTMAIFMGVVVIVGSLAALCYETAIILPEEPGEARSIAVLSLMIAAATSFFAGVFLYFIQLFGYIDLLPPFGLFLLTATGAFALSAFNIGCNWRMRQDDVGPLSFANMIRTIGAIVCQIIAALLGLHHIGLILGRLIGQVSATFYVFRSNDLIAKDTFAISFCKLRRVARKHCFFPLLRAPQSSLALLTEQIPALALGIVFGPTSAGLYWLAHRVLKLPCTVLSEAAAKVYYSECARRYRRSQVILQLALKTVLVLASVAFIPSVLIFIFAPELFSILGDEWRQAGKYGRWLSIWIFLVFCCSPIMITFVVIRRQRLLLKIDAISMLLRIILIAFLSIIGDALLMIMYICLFESAKILVTTITILSLCRSADQQLKDNENGTR